MANHNDIKTEMIFSAKRLHQKNMLAAADGNISYRISDNEILMTPAGKAKAFIQVQDIATITLNNKIISGNPSSERLMHLTIFQHCEKAKCVVHAHPPTAIAWTIARPYLTELPNECLSELILATGRVPIASYARPGTQAMGDVLIPFLPECRIIILGRHGALAWGESIEEATNGLERLEHSAEILLRAEQLGGITNLPAEEVAILKNMRQKIGDKII